MQPTSKAPREAAGIILADLAIYFMNELANNKYLDCLVVTSLGSAPPFDRLKKQCTMLFKMAHKAGADPKEVTDSYFDLLELIGAMERGEPLPLRALSDVSIQTIAKPPNGLRYTPQLEKKVINGYPPKRKGS
jgi:hypothetical protein